MKFAKSHMWVKQDENGMARVGLSAYVQRELGDIVYVELPKIGKAVEQGQEMAVLESTKAATDIYSPISGVITEINEKLKISPEIINQSPEQEGWICKIAFSKLPELDSMMDFAAYDNYVKGGSS